jgi:hypothetical protein
MGRRAISRDRPDDRRNPEFEFCIHGRPISARARNRPLLTRWLQQVGAAARAAWPTDQSPHAVSVELRVTHYAERAIADMDNLIKPIQMRCKASPTRMTAS